VVEKSSAETSALARVDAAVAKEMARDPDLSRVDALCRVTDGKEGRKLLAEYRAGREATIKAMNAIPIDVDRAKAEAHRWLQDAISRTMAEKRIDKAQATVAVCKTEQGQKRYQVMLGLVEPEKPRAPISKADAPFERIKAIAKTMLSAGKVKTIEEGVAKATKENPELYREYRAAMDAEVRG
jgi:hypothetical protein